MERNLTDVFGGDLARFIARAAQVSSQLFPCRKCWTMPSFVQTAGECYRARLGQAGAWAKSKEGPRSLVINISVESSSDSPSDRSQSEITLRILMS